MKQRKEYLSILFRGGPANRFYQYHTATYLAQLWNKTFVVDPSRILSNGMHHDPNFKITDFFKCRVSTVSKYHVKIRQFDEKGRLNPFWKDDLLEMDVPLGNVLLTDGWYQTFWDNHITIPKLHKTTVDFDASKTVFIHVRRGDFIKSKVYIDLANYYEQAYNKMEGLFSNSTYLICSDDIHWCKGNMKYIKNPNFVENTGYQETLWLMSKCRRGAILSNSTYGLWGAYLASINNKFDPTFKVFVPGLTAETDIYNTNMNKYFYPYWSDIIDI